ncbi:MAG: hypothetical protein Q4B80_04950 [Aerococcaceae bacterium]|nr:hypothetical protein [Aerococcaceae bacterium]
MSHSTLQDMQIIEQEAQTIRQTYQQQIEQSYAEIQQRLDVASKKFDEQTIEMVAQLKELLEAKQHQLNEQVAQVMKVNEQQVANALTSKRDALIQDIVKKVVETYGN